MVQNGLLGMLGRNAYSKTRPEETQPTYQIQAAQKAPLQPAPGKAPYQRGDRVWQDPLGANRTPVMGAMFNPIGEAFLQKTPAPLLDPIGYGAGWYKPGSKAGNVMNKVGDPLKIFRGLLG